MTNFSAALLLLLGIAVGPYGLSLVTIQLLTFLDPAVALAAAMVGALVGLTIDVRHPTNRLAELLLIVGGSVLVAAFRASSVVGVAGLLIALAAIATIVGTAGWLLVGETSSEGEQHVFVVGALLLLGGAATYLSLSAAFAGLLAGIVWAVAGSVAKASIVRDLQYFQHPLIVLLLIAAGAAATLSLPALQVAVVLVVVTALGKPLLARLTRGWHEEGLSALVPVGLVAVVVVLDAFRSDGRPVWAVTLLGATVIAVIVFGGMTASSARVSSA
jgi:hypothetical protein